MRRGGMSLSCAALVAITGTAVVSGARDAAACGGCYHPPPTPQQVETSVVSDHRMVFSIGAQQTILWDQIRYTGNPSEFAWVLPVRPGTTIELSRDEWIASLDAVTQPRIVQPVRQSFGGGGVGGDSNGGCGCGSMSSDSAFEGASADAPVDGGAPAVQVVSESVVGPYEAVIVRSDEPNALQTWLTDHGFEVPAALEPTIAAYTEAKMDFAALRLRPGQGVQAMQPVRIVSPGADPTLPLRMVQAGVGAHVGLTLYVISEGRYRPANFPEAVLDDTKLIWDDSTSRSNYQELSVAAMAQANGTTWLTEYANQPVTTGGLGTGDPTSLYNAYYNACSGKYVMPTYDAGVDAQAEDAGSDADTADAGDEDASAPDAGEEDAGPTTADAGIPSAPSATVPAPLCSSPYDACCAFDDLELALSGLHREDVWLTRIRADLPAAALNADLIIEAHPSQTTVNNVHNARFPDGTTAQIAPVRRGTVGTGLAIFGVGLLVARMVRRRRSLHTQR